MLRRRRVRVSLFAVERAVHRRIRRAYGPAKPGSDSSTAMVPAKAGKPLVPNAPLVFQGLDVQIRIAPALERYRAEAQSPCPPSCVERGYGRRISYLRASPRTQPRPLQSRARACARQRRRSVRRHGGTTRGRTATPSLAGLDREQLRLVGGLPVRESCAPAEIDGLTAGSAEFETTRVERCGCLPVAEVGHQGGQIGPRDDVEQFFISGDRRGDTSRNLSIVLTLGMTA